MLRIARQHDRRLDRAAVNAMAQFLRRKKSLRRAEARPAGGDREHAALRAQILRHQHHRCTVAAMARHHHELFHARSRDAFADRHPFPQRLPGRERLRARVIGVLGGNADPLHRQETDGQVRRQQFLQPRQIRLADHDIGLERQMRSVLFGRGQRQHRDPSRRIGFGNFLPGNRVPVAGRDFRHYSKRFFQRICEVVCRGLPRCIRASALPSWAKMTDGVQP